MRHVMMPPIMAWPNQFQVSVVIPVFNAERFVARAVESALAQPEVEEIILVEDNSPDQALTVCRQLMAQHPDKVRLFRHPDGRNHGAGPSRNLGIRNAKCPFIAFLDADDTYLPGRFVRDAELLLADDSLDGVHNALGVEFLDEEGQRWWHGQGSRPKLTAVHTSPPPEKLFYEMMPIGQNGWFHFDAITLRRRVFDRLDGFHSFEIGEDTFLAIQLAACCRLASGQTGSPVALRGVHAENRIRDRARILAAHPPLYRAILTWARRAHLPLEMRREIQRLNLYTHRGIRGFFRLVVVDPMILTHALFWKRIRLQIRHLFPW